MDNQEQQKSYQETLLIHYWYVLWKRINTVMLFLGIFMVTVLIASLQATKYYRSTAIIEISPKEPVIFDVEEVADMVTSSTNSFQDMRIYYQTQYRIIQSRAVLDEAIRRLEEEYGVEDLKEKDDPIEYMRAMMEIKPEVDTHLVKISFEHPDPEVAANVANVVSEVYMKVNIDRALSATRAALTYLEEQQEKYRALKQQSDERVHAYKYENDLAGLDREQNATLQRLDRARSQFAETHTERIQVEAVYRELRRMAQSEDWMGLATYHSKEDQVLRDLMSRYKTLLQDRTRLAVRYREKHPDVLEIDNEMAGVEEQIRAQVDQITESYHTELDLLLKKEAALQGEIVKNEAEVQELDRKLIELAVLKGEAERNEMFFRDLDVRLSEVDLSQVIRANNVRFVDRALPDETPVRPNLPVNMGLALVIGLLGGCGLAFFAEYLDATVKSREDVEQIVGVPFLGVVPLVSAEALRQLESDRDRSIIVHARPRSTVAECLRSIRTNILFRLATAEKEQKRLLVTSAAPREGKSFISANLATIMAMAGSRVLIIDADLRRPCIHKLFDMPNQFGLSDILSGRMTLQQGTQASHVPDLSVILAGPHPTNPAELLENGMMAQILAEASEYDIILIDSPPVNAVADPLVLSSLVHGVVFVVETNQTKRSLVRNARTRLTEMNANILGAVVNKLDVRRAGYGYYYYYYYENYPYYYGESDMERPAIPPVV